MIGLVCASVGLAQNEGEPQPGEPPKSNSPAVLAVADGNYQAILTAKLNSVAIAEGWDAEKYAKVYEEMLSQIAANPGTPPGGQPRYNSSTGIEDFEGAFPGSHWFVGDDNGSSGQDHWDNVTCEKYEGGWSAWCAGTGSQSRCVQYDNNMDAFMYVEAQYLGISYNGNNKLRFQRWAEIEEGWDRLVVEVEGFVDEPCHDAIIVADAWANPWYDNDTPSWPFNPWVEHTISLPSDFNPCLYVRVKFIFHSDVSTVDKGVYIDKIEFNTSRTDETIFPISGGFPPVRRWYADYDSDGCGDPNSPVDACQPPDQYVDNDRDQCPDDPDKCDDAGVCDCGVAEENYRAWYFDGDRDGCGDPDSWPLYGCLQPDDYVDNYSDLCPGDSDKCDNSGQCDCDVPESNYRTWYEDYDEDGCGDPNQPCGQACSPPDGCVDNASDQCPDNWSKCSDPGPCGCDGPDTPPTWYWDQDSDGCGDPNQSCGQACSQPIGCVDNSRDQCPSDSSKCDPAGQCGCGVPDSNYRTWYRDLDGDGCGDPSQSTQACSPPDPSDVDNNRDQCPSDSSKCDSAGQCGCGVSDSNYRTWYRDQDGDNYGDPNQSAQACSAPGGHVSNSIDCNDSNDSIHPGAPEVCGNSLDDDCAGGDQTCPTGGPTWYRDADSDGYGNPNDSRQSPTQPSGYVSNNTDCNDGNDSIHPGAPEVPDNGIDDDCRGGDAPGGTQVPWFQDTDSDGFGNPSVSLEAPLNEPPSGYVLDDTDCDDTNAQVNSAMQEICGDGWNNDCDEGTNDSSCCQSPCGLVCPATCPLAVVGFWLVRRQARRRIRRR